MDEQRAIELCLKHRDPVGFEFLAGKYRREAFFHAFALLGNQEDALDACQEAFARAFVGIVRLSALPKFYPWFYCILRNHCLNMLARRRTSDEFRTARLKETEGAAERINPGSLLEGREEQERVQRALAALKPEYREILTMKYFQEKTYEEIAGILGIPRGTVMSRLYHARMELREAYLNLDEALI